MTTKQKPVSEQLRAAILGADVSRYRISKDLGISEAALSRFVNGAMGLSLKSIDKISEYLELEVTVRNTSSQERN
jgi:transcriptional regulator with XRE-family HTH domain